MRYTLRALAFFASLHLTIFERPANFGFFNSKIDPFGTPYPRAPGFAPTPHEWGAGGEPPARRRHA